LSDFGTAFAPDSFYEPDVAKQINNIKNLAANKKEEKLKKINND
jgi:hypothetical protein